VQRRFGSLKRLEDKIYSDFVLQALTKLRLLVEMGLVLWTHSYLKQIVILANSSRTQCSAGVSRTIALILLCAVLAMVVIPIVAINLLPDGPSPLSFKVQRYQTNET
jgi:hypothetical protein